MTYFCWRESEFETENFNTTLYWATSSQIMSLFLNDLSFSGITVNEVDITWVRRDTIFSEVENWSLAGCKQNVCI